MTDIATGAYSYDAANRMTNLAYTAQGGGISIDAFAKKRALKKWAKKFHDLEAEIGVSGQGGVTGHGGVGGGPAKHGRGHYGR